MDALEVRESRDIFLLRETGPDPGIEK